MPKNDRFATSTRCKLFVDETIELSESLTDSENASKDRFFAEQLKDTETALARAQQDFPDDPEMSEIEARLWTGMKNKAKAMSALERAWKKMPKGMGTAIRLGKLHAAAGRPDKEYLILREALERSPDDKETHFAMAMHLLSQDPPDYVGVERHLSSSFTLDDQNFEARYMLAQLLFAKGEVGRAEAMFKEIARLAPSNFRKFAPKHDNLITARLPTYSGNIDVARDGYFFIRTGAYPSKVFAHRSAFDDLEVDEVEVGEEVELKIRFNRNGPVAVDAWKRRAAGANSRQKATS